MTSAGAFGCAQTALERLHAVREHDSIRGLVVWVTAACQAGLRAKRSSGWLDVSGSQRHGGLPAEGRKLARGRTSVDAERARRGHALLRESPPCVDYEPGRREHDAQRLFDELYALGLSRFYMAMGIG